jgi:hypothetical protein
VESQHRIAMIFTEWCHPTWKIDGPTYIGYFVVNAPPPVAGVLAMGQHGRNPLNVMVSVKT